MDNITEDERKVVEELRNRTINEITPKMLEDPSLFYRFSKARDFNLTEAEIMLRKHIAWRKEIGIDTILTDFKPTEVLLKYAPVSFVCFDKEECMVRIHDCGRMDTKGLLSASKATEILKYMIYYSEKDIEMLIGRGGKGYKNFQLGKPIWSPIYDFEELTYAKAVNMKSLQFLGLVVKTFIDNYPEFLRTITVINAPFYFAWIYAALKPLLPSTVIQKVRIFGSEGWKEALLENINADDLPAYLGGNKTDPDGNDFCESFILRGQPVPKSYYMQNKKKSLILESNVKSLMVMPFSKEEITFEVTEENSFLEWEFETKNRNIDFSLAYRRESSEDFELTELIPKQRFDTSDESEKGCLKCENLGQYTIVFDNSYSWFHSKEVYYRAGIKNPNNNDLFDST
ncbi:unnamed protein product [Larinioides sclopetarius]